MVEKIISWLAPHDCLVCGREGLLLCPDCANRTCPPFAPRCWLCLRAMPVLPVNLANRACPKCADQTVVGQLWVGTEYTGIPKQLVHVFKFERAQAAAQVLVKFMRQALPRSAQINDSVIVPIPTATLRRRARGYDHTRLLAKELAKASGLSWRPAMVRLGQSRQVGAKRVVRQQQLRGALKVTKPGGIKGRRILLVDDVVTTGATMCEAAKVLKQAGVAEINAVVFAQTK